jgi:predicted GH43/DUF377 family glycosyl hydrolase
MRVALKRIVGNLGEGHVVKLKSGETIFMLDSYEENPIVKPQELGLIWHENETPQLGAVFNPGAVLHQDKVILAPRCHKNYTKVTFFDHKLGMERHAFENYVSEVWILASDDGVRFDRYFDTVIHGDGSEHKDFLYGIEDVRITRYKEEYLLLGCGKIKPPFKGDDADRVAIYSTRDFKNIQYHGIIRNFDSRNAVLLFTEDEAYVMLRFYPHIYLIKLENGIDQLLNPASHSDAWKRIYGQRSKNLLLEAGRHHHEKEKIGAGPPPIKTSRGWLFLYHAVGELEPDLCREYGVSGKIERGYSISAAVLDLKNPQRVLCRTRRPLYIPSKPYELESNKDYPIDVPAVIFPTGAVTISNKLLLYCGAGDKYITLLSCNLENLMDYLFEHCQIT